MLTQPTPRPSARAASQRFCTAQHALARTASGCTVVPRMASSRGRRSTATQTLTGASTSPSRRYERYCCAALRREARRLGVAAPEEALADALARRDVPDDDEAPGLREADARRQVRGAEDALQGLVVDVLARRRSGGRRGEGAMTSYTARRASSEKRAMASGSRMPVAPAHR